MDTNAPENIGRDDGAAEDIALDEAFDKLSCRISTLTNAFDKFSDRQEQLVGRDYSEDLAKIDQSWEKAREAFKRLTDRPALALTPEALGEQMKAAGLKLREDEQRALREARSHLDDAVRSIRRIVASARTQEKQNFWIAVSAGVAAILAFMAGCAIPPAIDRAVPEDWHWPEERAAAQMQRGMWDAGVRLMQVADPERWNALARSSRLYLENRKNLAECEKKAVRKKAAVACSVEIEPPSAG